MRNLGELWRRCQTGVIPGSEWEYQRYLLIEGIQYFDIDIKDISFDRGLIYDHFGVGNCISSKFSSIIIPKPDYDVSRNAKVELFIRIATINHGETEWIPFGTYYVLNRVQEADKLRLECYDSIRFLEIPYLDGTEQINWPIPCTQAITKILEFIEVELDERTLLNPAFFVHNPGRLTMRQVLMHIAGMHGGNWYLTEENKLRLVLPILGETLGVITGASAKRITSSKTNTFDKVTLRYGKGDTDFITAGNGTNEIVFSNPWATQNMANGILAILKDYVYNTFSLQSADIDPALELGDTIEIEGVLANLWQVAYTLRLYANITIPSESEGGALSEFGGNPDSGGGAGNTYIPNLVWDFNESPIRVEKTEIQIASIDVNVTVAGNASGQFQITLMSDRESEVTIRIYDNNTQQLYTPTLKQVHKGFNQIGIPHPYIRLKEGLHLFTITMQTSEGYINIGTRSIMYSIELFASAVPPLVYDLRDVSLRQPSFAVEPTDVYLFAKHKDDYPVMLRTRYIKDRRLISSDFSLHWEFPNLKGAKELAVEFDGVFELFRGDIKQTLVTDDKPYIFWTDEADVLWCQYGDEPLTRLQIAINVLSISACRLWNSKVFDTQDLGLCIAYIKYDGVVAYKTKIQGSWHAEEILEEAEGGNSYVHVHRLNDYRVGFSVTGCNKHFISKRTLIGAAARPESVRFKPLENPMFTFWYEHEDADNEDFGVVETERPSQTLAKILFNHPIWVQDFTLTSNFTAESLLGDPLEIVDYYIEGEQTLCIVTEPYSRVSALIIKVPGTSSFTYGITNSLTSTTSFSPTLTIIIEGQDIKQSEMVNLNASLTNFSIDYRGLEFLTWEPEEEAGAKLTLTDFDVMYHPANFVDNDGEEMSSMEATLISTTIHHEYVGSEPL